MTDDDCLLVDVVLTELGVNLWGSSIKDVAALLWSSGWAKSLLFPASTTVRFGDASARASMRNVGRPPNDAYEETS